MAFSNFGNPGMGRGANIGNSFQDTIRSIGAASVPEDYVDEAEKVIKEIRKDNRNKLTTSQLRNLLSLTADIYNQAERCSQEELPQDLKAKIDYLRVRFVYESGRTPAVKNLVTAGNLIEKLKNIRNQKTNFIKFNRYMEALVAFHRYYGGSD